MKKIIFAFSAFILLSFSSCMTYTHCNTYSEINKNTEHTDALLQEENI